MFSREVTLHVTGSLDIRTASAWADTARLAARGAAVVVVDASDLERLDSTGAGALLDLTRDLGDQGCVLLLKAMQPEIREVLDVIGIVPLLNIIP